MKILCNNCNIDCHISSYKEHLETLMLERNNNLSDKEVIQVSECISGLMSNCIFCNNNKFQRFKGKYLYEKFYYYGDKHLLVNLYSYISEAIENKYIIYISIGREFYERLIDVIMVVKNFTNNIKFISLEDTNLILNDRRSRVKEEYDKLFNYNSNEFNGIKWIIDTKFIKNTSFKDNFFETNCKSREFVRHMNIKVLCLFDAYEHMHKDRKIIFEKITKEISI